MVFSDCYHIRPIIGCVDILIMKSWLYSPVKQSVFWLDQNTSLLLLLYCYEYNILLVTTLMIMTMILNKNGTLITIRYSLISLTRCICYENVEQYMWHTTIGHLILLIFVTIMRNNADTTTGMHAFMWFHKDYFYRPLWLIDKLINYWLMSMINLRSLIDQFIG